MYDEIIKAVENDNLELYLCETCFRNGYKSFTKVKLPDEINQCGYLGCDPNECVLYFKLRDKNIKDFDYYNNLINEIIQTDDVELFDFNETDLNQKNIRNKLLDNEYHYIWSIACDNKSLIFQKINEKGLIQKHWVPWW